MPLNQYMQYDIVTQLDSPHEFVAFFTTIACIARTYDIFEVREYVVDKDMLTEVTSHTQSTHRHDTFYRTQILTYWVCGTHLPSKELLYSYLRHYERSLIQPSIIFVCASNSDYDKPVMQTHYQTHHEIIWYDRFRILCDTPYRVEKIQKILGVTIENDEIYKEKGE